MPGVWKLSDPSLSWRSRFPTRRLQRSCWPDWPASPPPCGSTSRRRAAAKGGHGCQSEAPCSPSQARSSSSGKGSKDGFRQFKAALPGPIAAHTRGGTLDGDRNQLGRPSRAPRDRTTSSPASTQLMVGLVELYNHALNQRDSGLGARGSADPMAGEFGQDSLWRLATKSRPAMPSAIASQGLAARSAAEPDRTRGSPAALLPDGRSDVTMAKTGTIRAGMEAGPSSRGTPPFYPETLAKAKQLSFASRQVPTIEVNGTYYSTFKPATFAKWAGDAPDGFVFSLKGNRFITNRRVLAEAAEFGGAVPRFGHCRARRQARPAGLANGPDQEVRRPTTSPLFWRSCRTAMTARRCGMPSRCATVICGAGVRGPGPQGRCCDRLRRPPDLPGDRRRHRRFRLCPAADRHRRRRRPAMRRKRSTPGRPRRRSGPPAVPRPTCQAVRPRMRPCCGATSSSISSTTERCGRRTGPWR